jgi:hypothetical protein
VRSRYRRLHVLSALHASGVGAAAGLLATLAMYIVASADLAMAGVPRGSWTSAIETGFGGNAGTVLGLNGPALHAVHGLVIGAIVGFTLEALLLTRSWEVTGAAIGPPLGAALWFAVLVISPATRSAQGPGPPVILSLLMHLTFGVVVAVLVAIQRNVNPPAEHLAPRTPD